MKVLLRCDPAGHDRARDRIVHVEIVPQGTPIGTFGLVGRVWFAHAFPRIPNIQEPSKN